MRKIITLLVTIAVTLHIVAPYNQAYASESEENCNYLSKIDNLQGLLELEKSFAYKYLYMSRETNDDFYDYPWDIMVKVVLTVGDTYVLNP